jgi:hypothetical protein
MLLGVIVTARMLVPKESGMGTHTELGFPPCTFYVLTKLPCPGCGLTTSFSHLAHLQFVKAFKVHPFGPILFAAVLLMIVQKVIVLCTGYSISLRLSVKAESIIILILSLGFIGFFFIRCLYYYYMSR